MYSCILIINILDVIISDTLHELTPRLTGQQPTQKPYKNCMHVHEHLLDKRAMRMRMCIP